MNKERPEISGIIKADTNEKEGFQNEVLRPIIKMQHNLLIATFKTYLEKRKINFSKLNEEKKESNIEAICKKDIAYRNMILGMMISHFRPEEYDRYTLSISEYNRRIIQIVIKRLNDSISELL